MKILFVSYAYYPSVGGIESTGRQLVREFLKAGHEVRVISWTELGDAKEALEAECHRRPCLTKQLSFTKWADLVYFHNPSFKFWIPYFCSTSRVVSIHSWIKRTNGKITARDKLKISLLRMARCISVSRAVAESLPFKSTVIGNCYDSETYRNTNPWIKRNGAAYVGRLLPDKGIDTALESIAILREMNEPIRFSVIGDGPQIQEIKNQISILGLQSLVTIHGRLSATEINSVLNQVRYLLIPSKFEETFGVVALEGIAAGCIPIGTEQGGLPDAINGCGPYFAAGESKDLADLIKKLESDLHLIDRYNAARDHHLSNHQPRSIAQQYLQVMERTQSI